MSYIKIGRNSMVLGQWSDHMRKIDYYKNDLDTTVVLTNFSIILDLHTRQTDNCSIDNHAVLDVYYILNNFRKIKL